MSCIKRKETMTDKYVCTMCGEKIYDNQFLVAPNPFKPSFEIHGCPKCKSVGDYYRACDNKDCWLESTSGINTPTGYLNLCGKHFELIIAQKEADEEDRRLNKVLKTIEDNKPCN